ncbi:hypothetical protein PI124_g4255 [Phytophthora idaei]|nr:hypothetical protein PI125_g3385 [Phytophthora idaei]KAG3251078.1 hypothetical protein PI124_g4255 [Phytophthora idaei]
MPEQVTFAKVYSNGSVVKKQVPVFRDDDWKEWLEWLLWLSENFVFMGNVALQALRRLTAAFGARALIMDELMQMKKTRAMIVHWQLELNRHARTWDLARMVTQFEAIDRHKMEAELLRGGRLNVGKESSKTSKRSLLEDAVRT